MANINKETNRSKIYFAIIDKILWIIVGVIITTIVSNILPYIIHQNWGKPQLPVYLELVDKTTDSVNVKAVGGSSKEDFMIGYSLNNTANDITWRLSGENSETVFTRLKPNTKYYFFAYRLGNIVFKQSVYSDGLEVKTNPIKIDIIQISNSKDSITVKAGDDSGSATFMFGIATSDDFNKASWYMQDNNQKTFEGLNSGTEYFIYAYRISSERHIESDISSLSAFTKAKQEGQIYLSTSSTTANSVTVRATGGSGTGRFAFGISTVNDSRTISDWFAEDNSMGYISFPMLQPATTYYVFAYRDADDTYYMSDVGLGLAVTTDPD